MTFEKGETFLPDTGYHFTEYQKTISFEGQYINDNHRYYAECPAIDETNIKIGIEGWLTRADALKLYEMGFFIRGNILELGTYQGLSTSILSLANHDSGLNKEIHTVEIDESLMQTAQQNLAGRHLEQNVFFYRLSSSEALAKFLDRKMKFDFIFVDHSHEYEPVLEVCEDMGDLLNEGGYCLFHDYIHRDTFNDTTRDFKVYQAVRDGLNKELFVFEGVFGCTGLFRKTHETKESTILQLKTDNKKLHRRYIAMTAERNDRDIKIIQLTTEIEKLGRHYRAMADSRDEREARIRQLESELEELHLHYRAMTDERDSRISQMAAEFEELGRHYRAMSDERDERDSKIRQLSSERDAFRNEMDTLKRYYLMNKVVKLNKFLERHNLRK
jgi:SAM-dependent methyltransferase